MRITGVNSTILSIKKQADRETQQGLSRKKRQIVEKLKEATPVDTGEARDGWRVEGNSIVNDVEHLDNLNAGSSKQAPSHFVERTLLSEVGVRSNGIIVVPK